MKNFTIAIIGIVLLWGLSGCLYPGDHYVSGYYSDGYPYAHTYRGVYYDYPLFNPFGFYSLGYRYSHNSVYYSDRYYGHVPSRHYDLRKHNQHLKQNVNNHRGSLHRQKPITQQRRRVIRDGTRQFGSNRTADTLQRSVSPREQRQSVRVSKPDKHRQRDKAVVRSGHQKSGSRLFKRNNKENKRRTRCAGGRC